jgi:hypothetical protein
MELLFNEPGPQPALSNLATKCVLNAQVDSLADGWMDVAASPASTRPTQYDLLPRPGGRA